MLEYYKFKVDRGMITMDQVPQPYRTQLLNLQSYANQIIAGTLTLEEVPEPYRTQLVTMGYIVPEEEGEPDAE